MNHMTFERIKGMQNISTDCISRLRYIGLHNTIDTEEGGERIWTFMFKELSLISMGQKEPSIHEIQHILKKLNQEEIKRLQQEDPQYAKVIKTRKQKMKLSVQISVVDFQRVLYKKIWDYGKEFTALICTQTTLKICAARKSY